MAEHLRSPVKKTSIHVIFRGIEESYLVNTDVPVHYSISGALEVNARDWIGLYRVGWRSHSDYVYYEWSPYSSDYLESSDIENKVVFPAKKLPNDDGEFYQFCYVTSSGQVQGASTPFQFKSIMVDDLMEDEDENNEIVVVRTKTSFLKDSLEKANNTNTMLKKKIQTLEGDIDVLHLTEQNWSLRLQKCKDREESLKSHLEEQTDVLTEQKQANVHLQDCISSLQEKIEVLEQEKHSMEKRLDDNDLYISSLQEKIKNLVTEKDSLNGTVRVMEEELKEIFQEQEVLRGKLAEEEMKSEIYRKDVEQGSRDLGSIKRVYDEQIKISFEDKNMIGNLAERLQNAEDKLSAAEHCKMMLNEEVLSLKLSQEQTFEQYENSQKEVESLNAALREFKFLHFEEEKTSEKERVEYKSALKSKAEEISVMEDKCEKLLEELRRMEAMTKSEGENGSLFALQVAHQTLVERYASLSKKFESLQKINDSSKLEMKNLETENSELSKDNRSMRERLIMCQLAFKEKHAECEALTLSRNDDFNDNFEDQMSTDARVLKDKLKKYKKLLWKEAGKKEELCKKLNEKDAEIKELRKLHDSDNVEELQQISVEGDLAQQPTQVQDEDEKFVDGLKLCPVCSVSFDEDCTDEIMMNHVENHMMAVECPFCKKYFDALCKEEDVMSHVQSHFN